MDKQCYYYVMDVSVFDNEEIYNRTYSMVPAERKEKIDAFIPRSSKNLSLGAGYLLEYGKKDLNVGRLTPVSVEDQETESPLYYSLSHSGSRAVCAISDVRIGCDVEITKEDRSSVEREIKVAERFFTENECAAIRKDYEAFYRFWTLKESILKVTGYGLSMPLDCFEIDPGEDRPRLISRGAWMREHNINPADYRLYEPVTDPGYRYALCIMSTEDYNINVINVKI